MVIKTEVWKPIPGFNNWYEVSDLGNVRSWISSNGKVWGRSKQPKLLKQYTGVRDRKSVTLINSNKKTYYVHKIVAETFIGPCPLNFEVCHNNGDSSDNRLSNLRYDTHINNQADQLLHGTRHRGAIHHSAKTTEQDVIEIRKLFTEGNTQADIARTYGLTRTSVHSIVHRKSWTWLI